MGIELIIAISIDNCSSANIAAANNLTCPNAADSIGRFNGCISTAKISCMRSAGGRDIPIVFCVKRCCNTFLRESHICLTGNYRTGGSLSSFIRGGQRRLILFSIKPNVTDMIPVTRAFCGICRQNTRTGKRKSQNKKQNSFFHRTQHSFLILLFCIHQWLLQSV